MDRARDARERRRRTGGRSARVVNAVLEATLDVLARDGIAALTYESVASLAGVSRTTIYRRWGTRDELVRAALLHLAETLPLARDTGTLRGDLLEFIRLRLTGDSRQRDRAVGLIRANVGQLPEVSALARLVEERAHRPGVMAVERAIARGELPAGIDPMLVLDPIFATLQFRVFVLGQEPEVRYVEQLVDLVLAGARSGAAVRRT